MIEMVFLLPIGMLVKSQLAESSIRGIRRVGQAASRQKTMETAEHICTLNQVRDIANTALRVQATVLNLGFPIMNGAPTELLILVFSVEETLVLCLAPRCNSGEVMILPII